MRIGAGLLVVVCAVSCGSPTAPQTTPSINTTLYLNGMVDVMQANSYYRQSIDWTAFRDAVLHTVPDASTAVEAYPAISFALRMLGQAGDSHSFYKGANGTYVTNPLFPGGCTGPANAAPTISDAVGYLRVPGFSSTSVSATQAFIASLQSTIRAQDRPDLDGWIVDLRGNTGGSFWPMLAGVEPLLGDGIYGAFVRPDQALAIACGVSGSNGQCTEGGSPAVSFGSAYKLSQAQPRVALLTDSITVSAGELVLVSFLHQPNTRVFGSHTCGLPTGNGSYTLNDGAVLALQQSVSSDRTGQRHNEAIYPDEQIADPALVIQRAIAWVRGQ